MKKTVFRIVILLFLFSCQNMFSQDEMFKQKKERKRIWRKHRSSKDAYNPYLKKKAKDKPSAKINKGNKRDERRMKRTYKKQLKANKKKLNT